jgi:outer membrane protein TolC
VLNAFEEVENALTNLASHKAQATELANRRTQLTTVADQMDAQLNEGWSRKLQVLKSNDPARCGAGRWRTTAMLADTVALFKALGGGWPEETVGVSANLR